MGCNAWNHPPGCRCGWGGDGHKGKSPGGWQGGRYSTCGPNASLTAYSYVETENRATVCPQCGGDVFFIRHNGGSVWLDPPLGPPWYKHPCFDHEAKGGGDWRKTITVDRERGKYQSQSTKIFVVDSCSFSQDFLSTNIKGRLDDGEIYSISAKGDARRFAGSICFIDIFEKEVWPIDRYDFKLTYQGKMAKIDSEVYFKRRREDLGGNAAFRGSGAIKKPTADLYQYPCKLCKSVFSFQKDYKKHLWIIHGAVEISASEEATGFLVLDEFKFQGKEKPSDARYSPGELRSLIFSAIEARADLRGWAKLGDIGSWIYQHAPTFSPKDFGFKKMSEVARSLDYLEIKEIPTKKNPNSYEIYVKRKA